MVAGVLFSLIALAPPHQIVSESPRRVDYCALVKDPKQFASAIVIVHARLTELKGGEWGLDSHCFQPTLLALPDDVRPKPDFQLEKTEGVRLMMQARRERRVLFRADFIGGFDVAASTPRAGTQATFGKSRSTMRLVLREVQNAERIVIPRR